jgi:hypothetical protein
MATMNGNDNLKASSNMNASLGESAVIEAPGASAVSAIRADFGDMIGEDEIIHLDDDGTMDSVEMLEVIDKETMQKEKLINILCNRWQGNTVQSRRGLLTAIVKDDGGCFKHPFRTANQAKLDAFYKEVRAFSDLSKTRQSKEWTSLVVARQLYAFWSLVTASDSFEDGVAGGSRKRKSTEDKWMENFRALSHQAERKLINKELGDEGSLFKNIPK